MFEYCSNIIVDFFGANLAAAGTAIDSSLIDVALFEHVLQNKKKEFSGTAE